MPFVHLPNSARVACGFAFHVDADAHGQGSSVPSSTLGAISSCRRIVGTRSKLNVRGYRGSLRTTLERRAAGDGKSQPGSGVLSAGELSSID